MGDREEWDLQYKSWAGEGGDKMVGEGGRSGICNTRDGERGRGYM